ncbi:MAG: hypothetical protein RXP86_08435 [Acidilobus sp.]
MTELSFVTADSVDDVEGLIGKLNGALEVNGERASNEQQNAWGILVKVMRMDFFALLVTCQR